MKKYINAVQINMLAVTILAVVIIASLWMTTDYIKYSKEAESLRERRLSSRENLIQERIQETTDYIEYMRSKTESRLRELILNRTNEIYDLSHHLYEMYYQEYSDQELKTLLCETIRPIRFNDDDGYFFVIDFDGITQLNAAFPNLEGQNIFSIEAPDGQYVINDMIDIAETSGEGYYEYIWTKPDSLEGIQPKIVYIKLFEPFKWIIGTGIYVDDMEEAIQNEVLQRLDKKEFIDGSYVFAGQWDGLALTSPSKGENMIDVTDQNGVKIVQKLIETAQQGGGFVNYIMPPLEGIRSEPKISYVAGIDDWQWYVGTGLYISDIENEYNESKQELVNSLLINLARNFGILIVFLILTYTFARRIADKTVKELNIFQNFFRQAVTDSVGIDENTLEYEEFASLAKSANSMLEQRRQAEDALRESENKYRYLVDNATEAIIVAQDGVLKFVNQYFIDMLEGYTEEELTKSPFTTFIHPDDRDTILRNFQQRIQGRDLPPRYIFRILTKNGIEKYVEINVVLIEWEGRPATLNFLTDVTEQKRVERELQESEKRYRTYITNISDVIAILDKNLIIKYKSPNITRHFGWLPEDLIGKDGWETVHPDDREYIARELSNIFQTDGKTQTVQYRYLCKDGSYKYIELFAVNMLNDPMIKGILANYHDITEQRNTTEAVRESEEKFRLAFKTSPDSVNINKLDGTYIEINDGFTTLSGYTEEDVIGKTSAEINIWANPEDRQKLMEGLKTHGHVINLQTDFLCKDGSVKTGIMSASIITIQNEPYILSITRDISDRIKLEKQLLHAQKMESVGRLAGGIAHDFNNMLGVILGHTELALEQLDTTQPVYEDLMEVQKAAKRSADLTRQLLAFARKQTVTPQVLDLNKTVESMLKMLKRLIGEHIELIWHPGDTLWTVNMDPSQLDQILANLCVNARDAIDEVGTVTIETVNASFDETYCDTHTDYKQGEYVLLCVSDDGNGMDRETLSNLFEPFFTTKAVGKGTGLGLATIYGIVQQNNGFIIVDSELGQGSTFNLYLPRYIGKENRFQTEKLINTVMNGNETILIVEDELSSLKMIKTILEQMGYTVLTASTPGEALQVAKEHASKINLLVTDVIMPEMNGRELVMKLLQIFPDLKYLFMSGYSADIIAHHGVLEDGVHFIHKPFIIKEFATKVRVILDGA